MTLNGIMATFRVNSPKVTAFAVNYVKEVIVIPIMSEKM